MTTYEEGRFVFGVGVWFVIVFGILMYDLFGRKKVKKMDLCIIHPRLESRGGSERWVLRMAQHYNVPVYCLAYDPDKTFPEFKRDNVDVRIIKAPLLPLLFFLPKKIRESIAYSVALSLFKANSKIAICCSPPAELAAIRNNLVWYSQSPNRLAYDEFEQTLVKEALPKKVMYALMVPFFRMLDKFAVGRAKKVFANSENIRNRLKHYMDIDSEVLYQGINNDEFHSEPAQSFFFYPSRLIPSKRFEIAIDAVDKLNKRYGRKCELVIAGGLDRGNAANMKYFEQFSAAAAKVGGIQVLTDVPEVQMKKLYATCLCTVYTPKNEDFGLVPVEAAASGRPCIGINEGGLKETIMDGETGFLVNDSDELVERMELMLKTPKLADEMGARARLVCSEKFNWKRFFDRFDKEVR